MNRSRFLAIFLLAAATAMVSAQTPSQSPSSQNSQAAQTGQSSTSGAQQAGANPASPQASQTQTAPGSTTTNAPAGSRANTTADQSQLSETPETPSAAPVLSNSDLQSQIQNALTKEPTLTGDTVNVTVSAEAIDISGNVATAREKLTATRIVQSYAGNRKVMSHLAVGGHNRTASPDGSAPGDEPQEKSAISGRSESTKVEPAATSNRPQR